MYNVLYTVRNACPSREKYIQAGPLSLFCVSLACKVFHKLVNLCMLLCLSCLTSDTVQGIPGRDAVPVPGL